MPEDDDLYALADDPEPVRKPAKVIAPAPPGTAAPLAYQRPPVAKPKSAAGVLIDPRRDIHVPLALLIAGMLMYISYYAVDYKLGAHGIVMVGLGLTMMTVFKSVLMVGFALLIAGPLGVSFGGLWTAVLKLAAIAVFCDGLTTLLDAVIDRFSSGVGGAGFVGFGLISFPVALGLYWLLIIYLFSMDSRDSWSVVTLLSAFDTIVKIVLVALLMHMILNWGGAVVTAVRATNETNPSTENSMLAIKVNLLQRTDGLQEARARIASGKDTGLQKYVEQFYNAGCPNVWFELGMPDAEGHRDAAGVIVEMPTDPKQRVKCYEILKAYYDSTGERYDPSLVKDDGGQYVSWDMQ